LAGTEQFAELFLRRANSLRDLRHGKCPELLGIGRRIFHGTYIWISTLMHERPITPACTRYCADTGPRNRWISKAPHRRLPRREHQDRPFPFRQPLHLGTGFKYHLIQMTNLVLHRITLDDSGPRILDLKPFSVCLSMCTRRPSMEFIDQRTTPSLESRTAGRQAWREFTCQVMAQTDSLDGFGRGCPLAAQVLSLTGPLSVPSVAWITRFKLVDAGLG
jgi:hypothetical protein